MRTEYEIYKKILYNIPTHFVFCAKDRRRVFDFDKADDLFRKTCTNTCRRLGIKVYVMECEKEYVHLYVQLPPNIPPQEALTKIKRETAAVLNSKLLKLKERDSVWTWSALVATDSEFKNSDIKEFCNEQAVTGTKALPL